MSKDKKMPIKNLDAAFKNMTTEQRILALEKSIDTISAKLGIDWGKV